MIWDVAIIGAGIAGASLAAMLDARLSIILIEAEDQPGYHATGRSAAFWDECYGGPGVLPLTSASGAFLNKPPADISETSFLSPRGSLYLGRSEDAAGLRAFFERFASQGVRLDWLDRAAILERVPGLADQWRTGVLGADCSDIDVSALHAAFLAKARRNGVALATRCPVHKIARRGAHWQLSAGADDVRAKVIVNAAGAWADQIAALAEVSPLGLQPYRRTVVQLRAACTVPNTLPLVIDFNGGFYFKPEAGRLWLSPHDETPSIACDAAAEEEDVAIAIDRLSHVVDWKIDAVEHRWAGLRTFASDRLPIFGFDQHLPNFFWCAGQGGFGIQTAPASAQLCAALLEQRALPDSLKDVDPERYAPGRFQ